MGKRKLKEARERGISFPTRFSASAPRADVPETFITPNALAILLGKQAKRGIMYVKPTIREIGLGSESSMCCQLFVSAGGNGLLIQGITVQNGVLVDSSILESTLERLGIGTNFADVTIADVGFPLQAKLELPLPQFTFCV